ncbi:MAG TPA: amidohydrolase family protein [Acidimicrobiales bacterium]|nr:amidohydrolase family protein [Acidimicrobiales bacterium]
MYDLVIRDGTVVDGTGAPRRRVDVAVSGGRIAAVGDVDGPASSTIDADGLVVAPGFIDLHTHYDAQIFWDPLLSPSPLHGVTTVVGGNCGLTLAPVRPSDQEYLGRLLARVESIPAEAILEGVKYRWSSFSEFLDVAGSGGLGVNVGFLVGHCALRRAVMGPAASERAATEDEVASMCRLLAEGLGAGALGFSTSNVAAQVDGDGRPIPPAHAADEEFVALAGTCADFPGTSLEFIPESFQHGFSDEHVRLMAAMSAAAGRSLNWNTPLINRAAPDLHRRQLDATDRAARLGGRVVPIFMLQNGPLQHDFLRAYVFGALPGWGDVFALAPEARITALKDPATRQRLRAEADRARSGIALLVRDWDEYHVNEVRGAQVPGLSGRRVGDLAAERGMCGFDTMVDIAVEADLDAGFVRYQYPPDAWTQEARHAVMTDPRVVLGASDAGAHQDMLVGADFPTRSIAELVREKGVFTLEALVHQFTEVPARFYGMAGRGTLAEGSFADIVVFDQGTIGAGPLQTLHDLPTGASRLSTVSVGVEHVLVGGRPVVAGAKLTGDLPGRVLVSGRDTVGAP